MALNSAGDLRYEEGVPVPRGNRPHGGVEAMTAALTPAPAPEPASGRPPEPPAPPAPPGPPPLHTVPTDRPLRPWWRWRLLLREVRRIAELRRRAGWATEAQDALPMGEAVGYWTCRPPGAR
jgi:hypothetical protein